MPERPIFQISPSALDTSALSTSSSSSGSYFPRAPHPAATPDTTASTILAHRLARALPPLTRKMPLPEPMLEMPKPRRMSIPASERVAFVPPSQPVTPANQLPTSVPLPVLPAVDAAKRLAAFAAVDRHIGLEHTVIGIGSGSTVPFVVDRIVAQGKEANLKRVFIPTGFQSKELIIKAGLTLGDVDQYPHLDVTIDGADEVDGDLNSIKGGGACQLREKVLAEAAETWVIVADYRKNSQVLGTNGIPIEVVPFAYAKVLTNLAQLGSPERLPNGKPGLALRMGIKKAGPVVSDNGNFIIDAPFPKHEMEKPAELLYKIKMITGVVEVGLFCNMARAAYFGNEDGTVSIHNDDGSKESINSVSATPVISPPVSAQLQKLKTEDQM